MDTLCSALMHLKRKFGPKVIDFWISYAVKQNFVQAFGSLRLFRMVHLSQARAKND